MTHAFFEEDLSYSIKRTQICVFCRRIQASEQADMQHVLLAQAGLSERWIRYF